MQQAVEFAGRVNNPANRATFIAELVGELMRDPMQATALRSALTPHFGQPPVAPTTPKTEPQFYVKGPDGQMFIDPDKFAEWQTWREDRLREGFQEEMKPLRQVADELKTQKDAAVLERKVGEFSTRVHGFISQQPDYAANRQEIAAAFGEDYKALLEENPEATPAEIESCALRSYLRVTTPKAAQSAEARVQATLKAKAEGRTASPNGNQRSSVVVKDAPEGERLRAALKKELFPDAG